MTDQPLPAEGKQSVTDALIDLLRQRQAKGIETYGRSLQTWNGRNAVRDALEEAVDLSQYLLQWEMERADLIAAGNELCMAAVFMLNWGSGRAKLERAIGTWNGLMP